MPVSRQVDPGTRGTGTRTAHLLRQRPFLMLFAATWISFLGNGANHIAIFWLVLGRTGSATAVGSLAAVIAAAGIAVPPVAGVLVDRYDRRWVAVALDVAAALLVALIPLLGLFGLLQVWHVFLAGFATASVYAAYRPTVAALIEEIVTKDELVRANSLWVVAVQTAYLSGSALAGVLIFRFTPETVLALDALTYLGSAACLLWLRRGIVPVREPAPGQKRGMWREFIAGLSFIAARRPVLNVCLLTMFPWVTINVINALLAPYVRDVLLGSSLSFGIIDASIAVGSIGAGVAGAWLHQRLGSRTLFWLGLAVTAACTALYAPAPYLVSAVMCSLGIGLATTVSKVIFQSFLQRTVSREYLGRVSSTTILLGSLLSVILLPLVGCLAETLGIQLAFITMACVLGGATVWAFFTAHSTQ